ncbi:MAG: hypothetical protein HOE83_08275 [Alphaproteobacteria bacterium]|nr:hypothetical protein [Alphaproteobacteria bacterium]
MKKPQRKRDTRRERPTKPHRLNIKNLPPAAYVSNLIWRNKKATPNHRDIFFAMAAHADRYTGVFYVSLERIAHMTGFAGQSSIEHYVADLIRWGNLRRLGSKTNARRHPKHRGAIVYQIVFNKAQDQDELIAHISAKDRTIDLPIEMAELEPVAPEKPREPPKPTYGFKPLLAVSKGPTEAPRPGVVTVPTDFDIF